MRVALSCLKAKGPLSYVCLVLFFMGMMSLKVLNSIILVGKSCIYIKEANMEDRLTRHRPASAPRKAGGRPKCRVGSPTGGPVDSPVSTPIVLQPAELGSLAPKPSICHPVQPPPMSDRAEGPGATQNASESKRRTRKEDLLDIDRFTICGNRID